MTDEVKRFGARERPQSKPFELQTLTDDGSVRVHRFQLVPIVPAGHVTALMDALENEPEKSFGLMVSLLSRLLDNTDGTPAAWRYLEYVDPDETESRDGDPAHADETGDVYFTGPDSTVYNAASNIGLAARVRFEDPDEGSSRRRWEHLMDPANQDEAVNLSDLVDIAKWVVGVAIDRPTSARTSSTRGSRKTKR